MGRIYLTPFNRYGNENSPYRLEALGEESDTQAVRSSGF